MKTLFIFFVWAGLSNQAFSTHFLVAISPDSFLLVPQQFEPLVREKLPLLDSEKFAGLRELDEIAAWHHFEDLADTAIEILKAGRESMRDIYSMGTKGLTKLTGSKTYTDLFADADKPDPKQIVQFHGTFSPSGELTRLNVDVLDDKKLAALEEVDPTEGLLGNVVAIPAAPEAQTSNPQTDPQLFKFFYLATKDKAVFLPGGDPSPQAFDNLLKVPPQSPWAIDLQGNIRAHDGTRWFNSHRDDVYVIDRKDRVYVMAVGNNLIVREVPEAIE